MKDFDQLYFYHNKTNIDDSSTGMKLIRRKNYLMM
jgi:hypothetical protein